MFVVANRVPVTVDWKEEFETRFRRRAGQIDKQPGFVRMEILRPVTPETPYVVYTVWENEAAFRAWVGSEDFRAAHANPLPKEAFTGKSKMEQYEVVVSADRV
jgi:heme-degrading monooxygenase HmoA